MYEDILRELKIALKKDDETLRREIARIIRKYGKKKKGFEIKAGHAYYVNESRPIYARKIFFQVLEQDISGLYISRENPANLDFNDLENAEVLWLSTTKGENRVSPGDLTKIQAKVVEFLKEHREKSVVVVEGIETMITNTSFVRVLHLLQRLRDLVSERRGVLIITLDMDVLNPQDRALFKKEIVNEIPVKKFT